MTKVTWGGRCVCALALAVMSASCGTQTRQGTASSYLIITSLQGASGADKEFGTSVNSDVLTVLNDIPSVFDDPGQVTFQLALKDPGSSGSPNSPTPNNYITITQYHVKYVRSDGHNVQGVDVPYEFDGAITGTVSGSGSFGFTLVRHAAKEEAPLQALIYSYQPISTIAQVTFYGHDQTGREVSVSGQLGVTFWNFADPK